MERIRETIKLDSSMPWTETLVVTYPETIDVDVDDDLNRELALFVPILLYIYTITNFYFHSAISRLCTAHKLPRPSHKNIICRSPGPPTTLRRW
jgi:hypothetical protein